MALDYDLVRRDNRTWQEIFNRRPLAQSLTVGRLLTRESQSIFGAVIVDLGSENTLRPVAVGDLALSGDVALGEVTAVYPQTAKVQLYSTAGRQLEVLIGEERLPAPAIGRGGGNFYASLPRDLAIKIGMPVTVLIGAREYLLGVVKVVDRDPSEAFQKILFRSPVNLILLSWLEIYGS